MKRRAASLWFWLTVLAFWLLVAGILGYVSRADSLTPAQHQAAMVAAGESMSDEGYVTTLCVMHNRQQQWGHRTFGPRTGWYARPRRIGPERIAMAIDVFSGNYDCGPWLYALSKQDVQRHRLDCGDLVIRYTRRLHQHFCEVSPWQTTR